MTPKQYDFLPWTEDAILETIDKLKAEMTDMRKALFARIGELKKEQIALVAEIEELREIRDILKEAVS